MSDLRDKLLALDREGLEQVASRLGISVTESMSRAELIISIETANTDRELTGIQLAATQERPKKNKEYLGLIFGLIFVSIGTIVWGIDTYLILTGLHGIFFDVALSLVPSFVYWVSRFLGGFLIAEALISLAFKKGDEQITPLVRAVLILAAVLIIIIAIFSVPFLAPWLGM